MQWRQRLRVRLLAATLPWVERFLLPGMAVFFPWPTYFKRTCRLLAGRLPYRLSAQAGVAHLLPLGIPAGDPDWVRRHQATWLVEHADMYLALLRSRRWTSKHLEVEGEWPQDRPFVAVSFHWGAGLWVFRHLRDAGCQPVFLSGRPSWKSYGGSFWRWLYAHLRVGRIRAETGDLPVFTGGARKALRDALDAGKTVVAITDVPPEWTPRTATLQVGEWLVTLPTGVTGLAAAAGVPLVPFTVAVDVATGRHRLKIYPAARTGNVDEYQRYLAEVFVATVLGDSAQWHLAHMASRFLTRIPQKQPWPLGAGQ